MRTPHFLDWNGEKVLALWDGMSAINRTAIAAEDYDVLCLFKGDWPDLTHFADVACKVQHLSTLNLGLVDIKSIAFLTNLESVSVSHFDPLRPGDTLDFSGFEKLRKCTILDWRPEFSTNLFAVSTLTDLAIGNFPEQDLVALAGLTQLQSLALDGAALTTLAGIRNIEVLFSLPKLKLARFIGLDNFSLTGDALFQMAKDAGRELKLDLGRGARKSTVTLELS